VLTCSKNLAGTPHGCEYASELAQVMMMLKLSAILRFLRKATKE